MAEYLSIYASTLYYNTCVYGRCSMQTFRENCERREIYFTVDYFAKRMADEKEINYHKERRSIR